MKVQLEKVSFYLVKERPENSILNLRIKKGDKNVVWEESEIEGLAVGVNDDNGEIVGFEIELFPLWHHDIVKKLEENPLPYRFNYPEANLKDATVQEVLSWAYNEYALPVIAK
jgi:hypothetical protein